MPAASRLLKAFSVSKRAVVLVLFRAWRLATLSEAETRLLWNRPGGCENDVGGRFTKRPCRDSQGRFHPSSVFFSVCALMARPAAPTQESSVIDRSAPLFEALARAWDGAGFHKPAPPPRGRSRPLSIPLGRQSRFGSSWIGSGRFPARGQEPGPLLHQDPAALEEVRASIGRLEPVPDHMRQGRLDHLPGMIRRPLNPVKVFTRLYLCRVEQLLVPPWVTLYQRGLGIRFVA